MTSHSLGYESLCKSIHAINYFTSISPFESGKYGDEGKILQKNEFFSRTKKSFLDEIKNISHSFYLKGYHLVEK